MKLSDSLLSLSLPDHCRIIAISDVHANAPALTKLLKKIQYTPADYLLFLGDLFERCPYFDETIDLIENLRQQPHVYFIRGNWEQFVFMLDYERFNRFYDKDRTLFMHWAKQEGLLPLSSQNFKQVKTYLYQKHQKFLDWTFAQHLGIETEDMVFVHAGLSPIVNWCDSSESDVIRNWDYINKVQYTGKWVVSGHVPSSNYQQSGMTALPIINHQNHIILIDGGSGITKFGQVNALVIEKDNHTLSFSYDFADNFPVACAQKEFVPSKNVTAKTDWRNIYFDVINTGQYFSYVSLVKNGDCLYVKNEYITEKNGHLCASNYMCNLATVRRGEVVSIIDNTTAGYWLIKKQTGEIGWAPCDILPPIGNK